MKKAHVALALAAAITAGTLTFLDNPSTPQDTTEAHTGTTGPAAPALSISPPSPEPPAAPAPARPPLSSIPPVQPLPTTAPLPVDLTFHDGTPRTPRYIQPAQRSVKPTHSAETVENTIAELAAQSAARKAEAIEWANAHQIPVRGTTPDGRLFEIAYIEDGQPFFYVTANDKAAVANNVQRIRRTSPDNLDGSGWHVGVWEGSAPKLDHKEFFSGPESDPGFHRVYWTDEDESATRDKNSDHATHVIGTIAATGLDDRALGMAPSAIVQAYEWDNDHDELIDEGARFPGQPDKLYVSNHSYGIQGGWVTDEGLVFEWTGVGGEPEDRNFGRYTEWVSEIDLAGYMSPYLLQCWAAGNERFPLNSGPVVPGVSVVSYPLADGTTWGGLWLLWPPLIDFPTPDNLTNGGYDTTAGEALAKNVLTVGAADNILDGTRRSPSQAGITGFSSWGPCDDGRIKPDVVARGAGVYSTTEDGGYGTKDGTSMASPTVAGAAVLLHQLYHQRTGEYLLSSSAKALIVHTADDILTDGPDYQSGYGLVNAEAAANLVRDHADRPENRHLTEDTITTARTTVTFPFVWNGTDPVRATLCWTDLPGSEIDGLDNPAPALVNDLDLTLTTPDGQTLHPYRLDPANPDNAATTDARNPVDNLEQVYIASPVAGTYRATVSLHGSLDEDVPQRFSLILSGNEWTGTLELAIDDDRNGRFASTNVTEISSPLTWTNDPVTPWTYESRLLGDGDWARSGNIPDSALTTFSTTVSGPATVQFAWAVSSEPGKDFLAFTVDGGFIDLVSGDVPYTTKSFDIGPGPHVLRWSYIKDESGSAGEDAAWVDDIRILPNSIGAGLDNDDYTWTLGDSVGPSDAPWLNFAWTPSVDVAAHPPIGWDDRAAFSTTVTGPALVKFRWLNYAGPYSRFDFEVEGETSRQLEGVSDLKFATWQDVAVQVPPGSHELRWAFIKFYDDTDGAPPPPVLGGGLEGGKVDAFEVVPLPTSFGNAAGATPQMLVSTNNHWVATDEANAPAGLPGTSPYSLRAHSVPEGGSAAFSAFVDGPGLFSWWSMASNAKGDILTHTLTDRDTGEELHRSIKTGADAWQQHLVDVPPGRHRLTFDYNNGSPLTAGLDTAFVDNLTFIPGAEHPARGLDHHSHQWSTGGDALWTGALDGTNGGRDSTTSGEVPEGGTAWIQTRILGPATLQFDWRAAVVRNSSYLRFRLDNTEPVAALTGATPWRTVTVPIPPGSHLVRWQLEKTGSKSNPSERAFLDAVSVLHPEFGVSSVERQPGGDNLVAFKAVPSGGYKLDCSPDLKNWTRLHNDLVVPDDGTDTGTYLHTNPPATAFYRLVWNPEDPVEIPNASFESPNLNPNTFTYFVPGWNADGSRDVFVENWEGTNFPAHGDQVIGFDVNIRSGIFTPSSPTHYTFAAAVGHRSGWTFAGNLTQYQIITTSGNVPLASGEINAHTDIPEQSFLTPPHLTHHTADPFRLFLISAGTGRGYIDDLRLWAERQ